MKSDINTSSPCKKTLQQDQEKITKTDKSQMKPKQKKTKLKAKQPVKTKNAKKMLFQKKKVILTNKS